MYPYGPVNLSIRPWKNIHTALSYGPVRLFNKSATNWLFLYWPWYRFSVSSIGPGIDSRSAVLALGPRGPIQKQPVSNTILWRALLEQIVDSSPCLGQSKNYNIGTCCFSANNTVLRSKSKDCLVRNQNNVSEWSDKGYPQTVISVSYSTITIYLGVVVLKSLKSVIKSWTCVTMLNNFSPLQ